MKNKAISDQSDVENPLQLYFVCDLKMSAMMKEKMTAAETPALAAASGPVSA